MGMTEKQKRKYHNTIKKINLVDAPIKPLENELWRPMKEHENEFLVSSKGRIYDIKKARLASTFKGDSGYIFFWHDDIRESVHRLVATHFLRNTLKQPIVNHNDESRDNNDVDNLEWCTHKYNINYGTSRQRQQFNASKYFNIQMIDAGTNTLIDVFETIRDAAKFIEGEGIVEDELTAHSNILQCVVGRTATAYGYKWIALIETK